MNKKVIQIFEKNKFNTFEDLEILISELPTTKEQGDAMELFCKYFFKLNEELYQVKNIWLLEETPLEIKEELNLTTDFGVDLVLQTNDNKLFTIQSKFHADRSTSPTGDFQKTVAESKKASGFYIFQNSYDVPKNIKEKHSPLLLLLSTFLELENTSFFNDLYEHANKRAVVKEKYSPRPHQQRAIDNVVNGFSENFRGRYISACGTGKTLTSLWIHEALNSQKVLFLVPNLYLVRQTLKDWIEQRNEPFKFICVCSDQSIKDDEFDISVGEIGFPVTTNEEEIKHFFNEHTNEKIVVFSTYQSMEKVSSAIKNVDDFSFDICFSDEAHRTAGVNIKNSKILDDKFIPSKQRLFMTATPKIIKSNLINKFEDLNKDANMYDYFSMDNEKDYGPVFENYSFGEAIKDGVITNYQVHIPIIYDEDLQNKVDNTTFDKDTDLTFKELANSISLERVIQTQPNTNKIINFSANIENSIRFVSSVKSLDSDYMPSFIQHIDSKFNSGMRKLLMRDFSNTSKGILSNAKCLTEGVDIPDVDTVVFSDPRSSFVDIIQAIGRALRIDKQNPEKVANIVIPVFKTLEEEDFDEKYMHIYSILQSLKFTDQELSMDIDFINSSLSTNKVPKDGFENTKIKIYGVENADIESLRENIYLNIARFNSIDSIEIKKTGVGYEKSDDKKSYNTDFSVVRYNLEGLETLINKGLQVFKNKKIIEWEDFKKAYFDLHNKKVDNNFRSHAERTGVCKFENGKLSLTNSGNNFLNGDISLSDSFKLKTVSEDNVTWYPYNVLRKLSENSNHCNFLQFMYGPYLLQNTSSEEINKCLDRMKKVENYNYEIAKYNKSTRNNILLELNEEFKNDLIWDGQFREQDFMKDSQISAYFFVYLPNHFQCFGEEEVVKWMSV